MLPIIKSKTLSIAQAVNNAPYPCDDLIEKYNNIGKRVGCVVTVNRKGALVGFRDPETNTLYKAQIVTSVAKVVNAGDYIEFYLAEDYIDHELVVVCTDCGRLQNRVKCGSREIDILPSLWVSTKKIQAYGISSGIYKAAERWGISTKEFLAKAERENFDIGILRHVYISTSNDKFIVREKGSRLNADKYVDDLDQYLKELDFSVFGWTTDDEFIPAKLQNLSTVDKVAEEKKAAKIQFKKDLADLRLARAVLLEHNFSSREVKSFILTHDLVNKIENGAHLSFPSVEEYVLSLLDPIDNPEGYYSNKSKCDSILFRVRAALMKEGYNESFVVNVINNTKLNKRNDLEKSMVPELIDKCRLKGVKKEAI